MNRTRLNRIKHKRMMEQMVVEVICWLVIIVLGALVIFGINWINHRDDHTKYGAYNYHICVETYHLNENCK